jgi:peptide/nickel transport system permease protein
MAIPLGVRGALRQPLVTLSAIAVIVLLLLAIGAPWLAPFDPVEMHSDALFHPPSPEYPLGTDDFGRDVLSRIMWGARVSLPVAFFAIAIGHALGVAIGLISGTRGGQLDLIIQRVIDAMLAFPVLVLALAIVASTGPSLLNVILAIAAVEVPRSARVIRLTTLTVREADFVQSARTLGARETRVMLRHILPNCVPTLLVISTASLGQAMIVEASLSYLGLGIPPPQPSWGGMLAAAQGFATKAPWLIVFPGLAISLAVYAFSVLGDALRDTLDPRLMRR